MNGIIIFLLVLIVGNSFVLLEEETIVLIASIVWVDAAGGLIREALTTELEGKGDKIKETFDWYLYAQKELIGECLTKHVVREDAVAGTEGMYEEYIEGLLGGVYANYESNQNILANQERRHDLVERGLVLINELSRREMQTYLGYPGNSEA